MKRIYKYQLTEFTNEFNMPDAAQLIHVEEATPIGLANPGLYMWALVDMEHTLVKRRFHMIGTGWDIEDSWWFIGTIVTSEKLVWHVFEEVSYETH